MVTSISDHEDTATYRLIRSLAHKFFNNIFVETAIIITVGATFVVLKIADTVMHTRSRNAVIRLTHNLSKDRLSIIRKAQIRYLFRHEYGLSKVTTRLAGGSYWMSIPCIVEGTDVKTGEQKRFMGKIINDRSALKHKYMTRFRNLGVIAEGAEFVFDGHTDALDMVVYERDSLRNLKKQNVDVPDVYGLHKLNFEDYMLVMEYIDGEPLSGIAIDDQVIDQVFLTLKIMHDNGVFHGDVKLDNFLFSRGLLVVVDCLKVDKNELHTAQDFDLICAVCALAQKAPVETILPYVKKYHTPEELQRSVQLIGIALNKVDMDLSMDTIRAIIDGLGPGTRRINEATSLSHAGPRHGLPPG